MKKLAFNPYLPCWEYVPDGEPHVFGDRLYVYGSHDAFSGHTFCQKDYTCWSAPVDDLSDWHCHGVIYRKDQDPMWDGQRCMYAPDVTCGPDGRYYLYYTLDFLSAVSVAVADEPGGPYEYYGVVRDMDGHILGQRDGDVFMYDPGVLTDEDGSVHLYTGVAAENSPLGDRLGPDLKRTLDGSYHYLLDSDMLTVLKAPVRVAPGWRLSRGTDWAEHPFFEASSIRRIGDTYYFIWSTTHSHELAYATSGSPEGPFTYGGVLVSIGDIGMNGRTEDAQADNFLGTTHGSIVCVKSQWYVFYHRQSNDNQLSRQACAEKITIAADGSIAQAEVTSCGLNDGPLPGKGTYEARIACNLSGKGGPVRYMPFLTEPTGQPYYTQDKPDGDESAVQYITNLTDGSWCGFKYFAMEQTASLKLQTRGSGEGFFRVSLTEKGQPIASVPVRPSEGWAEAEASFDPVTGTQPLYLTYEGSGQVDLLSITLA